MFYAEDKFNFGVIFLNEQTLCKRLSEETIDGFVVIMYYSILCSSREQTYSDNASMHFMEVNLVFIISLLH